MTAACFQSQFCNDLLIITKFTYIAHTYSTCAVVKVLLQTNYLRKSTGEKIVAFV